MQGYLATLFGAFTLACTPGAAIPVPGGWHATPDLWITPEVVDEYPAFAGAVVRAADAYCRAGHHCIRVHVGRGPNEVRVADTAAETGSS